MNPLTNVKNITKLSEQELRNRGKSSWHDQYKDSAWIFVGGLPYDLTEGDILCVFSQYGEIVNINLVREKATGKSHGFCFLCYEDQRSTVLAVDNLNAIKILGRTIRVDHCSNYKPPKDSKNLTAETRKLYEEGCLAIESPLDPPLSKVKKEEEQQPQSSSYQPVPIPGNFKIKREIKKEKKEKKKKKKEKYKLKEKIKKTRRERSSSSSSEMMTGVPEDSRRLWLGNLDDCVTEYHLLKLIQKFGTVEKFDLIYHKTGPESGKSKGYAFVTFVKNDDAVKMLQSADGKLFGSKRITVKWAHSHKEIAEVPIKIEIPVLGGPKQESKKSRVSQIKAIESKLALMSQSSEEVVITNKPTIASKPPVLLREHKITKKPVVTKSYLKTKRKHRPY